MRKWMTLLLVIAGLSSCSKKDEPAPTTFQLISQHTWILNTLSSTDANFQSSGQLLIGSDWQFRSDHVFSLHVAVSGVQMTFTGTWGLSDDEKIISLSSNMAGTFQTSQMEIQSVTTSSLKLKEVASGMTNTYTFSKQ